MIRYFYALAAVLLLSACAGGFARFTFPPGLPTTSDPTYQIAENEIPAMETDALRGDGDDALKLTLHYEYYALDHRNAMYWLHIAAENGNPSAEKHLADLLEADNQDPKHYMRSYFWAKKAAQ